MDTTQATIIVAVLVVALMVGLAAWFYHRRQESRELPDVQVGPEYSRAVRDLGSETRRRRNGEAGGRCANSMFVP